MIENKKMNESILNCRPLTKLTDEVNTTMALTPMMLLSDCVDPGYPFDVFLNSDNMRSSWRAYTSRRFSIPLVVRVFSLVAAQTEIAYATT